MGGLLFTAFKTHQLLKTAQNKVQDSFNSSYPEYHLQCNTISTNYFSYVALNGIKITDLTHPDQPTLLDVQNIKLNFSLTQLVRRFLKKEELKQSIESLEMIKPSLKLVRKDQHWRIPQSKAKAENKFFAPFNILIQEGSLEIEDSNPVWNGFKLGDLNGPFNLNLQSPKIEISARTGKKTKLRILSGLDRGGSLLTQLNLEELSLASSKHIPGIWNVKIVTQNSWPLSKEIVLTSSVTLQSQNSKLEGGGIIDFKPQTPQIDLKISGETELGEIVPNTTFTAIPKGKIQVEVQCLGDLKNPKISGSIKSLETTLENEPLKLAAQFSYEPSQLNIDSQTHFGKSLVRAYGTFSKEKNSWRISLKELPLSLVLKNKMLKAGGALTSTLTGSKNGGISFFSGPLEITNASLKDHKLGNLQGSIKSNPQFLNLNLKDETLKNKIELVLRHEDSLIRIEKGSLLMDDKEKFRLEGVFDKSSKKMEGTLAMNGSLNGSLTFFHHLPQAQSPWEGGGHLNLKEGQLGTIQYENGEIDFTYDPNKVELKKFFIKQKEGELSLEGKLFTKNEKNPLEAKAHFKSFKIQNSNLNGSLHLTGDLLRSATMHLTAKLTSQDFSWNKFSPGKLGGEIEYKNKVLSVKSLTWGNVKLQANLAWDKNIPTLTGHWSTSKKTVKDWCSIFKLKEPPLLGDIALSGNVSGELKNLTVSITGQLENVKVHGKNGETKENFKGTLKALFSEGFLKSLTLHLNSPTGAEIKSQGEANLKTGAIDMENSFINLDVEFLQDILGWKGFKGYSAGFLKIQGDWNAPIAKGKIVGSEGTLGSIPLDSWEVSGTFQEKLLLITSSKLIGRKNSWRFTVLEDSWLRLKPDQEIEYRLATDFANIPIGEIFLVGSGVAKGSWEKDPATNSFMIQSEIRTNDCLVNELELKPSQFSLEFQKGILKFLPSKNPIEDRGENKLAQIKGEINLNNLPCFIFKNMELWEADKRILLINGEICKDKPSFQINGEGVEASVLTSIIKSPIPISGKMNLNVKGSTQGKQSEIVGEIKVEKGSVGPVPLDSLDSKFKWSQGTLDLSQFQANTKDLFSLSISGNLPLKLWGKESQGKKVNLTLSVPEGDLSFLNYLESDLVKNAKGPFKLNLSLKGNTKKPKFDGKLQISDGELDSRYFGQKGKNLDLELLLQSNRMTFKEAKFNIGKGKLLLSGSMDSLLEDGEMILDNFDFKLQTSGRRGIPIQVPELPLVKEQLGIPTSPSKGFPTLSIHLTGNREQPSIKGWIELERTLFSYPPSKKTKKEHGWVDNVDWDLLLKTGDQTIFQNEYAYARIDGKIHLRGSHENFLVSGKINSNEGTISLYGAKFQLRQAELEIVQPAQLKVDKGTLEVTASKNVVYLSFKAEQTTFKSTQDGTDKLQDTITLNLDKTPLNEDFDSKKITFRSSQNPNLSSERVAMSAGLGINLEEQDPVKKDIQLRQGIARLLDSQLASPLARSILQRTGIIDRIEISQETQISRSEELRGTERTFMDAFLGHSVVLEKTFGAKLGVGYRATLDKIRDRADFIHQLELRYPFYKGLWLYGSTELDSRENLGRDPERRGGIKTQIRFDPSDWLKKKAPKEEEKKE